MTRKQITNVPASVRQRLLNISRKDKRPFNELIQYYAMERFLYRLSQSDYADSFILKGALALQVRKVEKFRPTMDIDISQKRSDETSEIIKQIKGILSTKLEEDGLVFDLQSMRLEDIKRDTAYKGMRVLFHGALDSAKINMQIDISFRDVIFPEPKEKIVFPCILEFPAPKLWCYSLESIVAEKFEALMKLGDWNSRMKDFYDLWVSSRQHDFYDHQLSKAIGLTFKNRGSSLKQEITAFKQEFIKKKEKEWKSFIKTLNQEDSPSLSDVIEFLKLFLLPIVKALTLKKPLPNYWKAPGPWVF
ncbi:MAG: nucleotidyl transferase AbiEii/AbiGii toxin family protein [Oligoflexia bacterium]|nr:nucleotidyl transferase AbiEii/AbiGii toxin family protein [Oligoflexia bacterium]